jgi:formylglycine-generating enzyme required for sulfatase activity
MSDSFFGVVDIAGNVWEWCLTEYETGKVDIIGTNVRVLRGGSWLNNDTDGFRRDNRNGYDPHYRNNLGGVRLALSF